MPPSSQLKSRKFGRAVAMYLLPSHRGSSFRGGGGLQGPLARQGLLARQGPLLFLRVWVAWTSALPALGRWAWIWGTSHEPAFRPGDLLKDWLWARGPAFSQAQR